MKIRITKNTEPQSWYRRHIGKIFEVLEVNELMKHYVVHKGRIVDSYVDFDDCEVLNEATESEVIVCIDCKSETQVSSDKLCYRCTKLREQANTTKRN